MSDTTTMRMFYPEQPDHTSNGYTFSDLAHAREWLTQKFVKPAEIRLEEVAIGPLVRCRHCDGNGHTQSIKLVRKLTVNEFLNPKTE